MENHGIPAALWEGEERRGAYIEKEKKKVSFAYADSLSGFYRRRFNERLTALITTAYMKTGERRKRGNPRS